MAQDVTYLSYLKIPELLALQEPLSDGPEHDELLFIVIHQTNCGSSRFSMN
jgi:tryptophan 2,3-dioxygenase